jgi:hypothetical protein
MPEEAREHPGRRRRDEVNTSEKCPFDPTTVHGAIGMFHCRWCGEMLVAGMPHPDYHLMNDPNWEGWAELERSNARQSDMEDDTIDVGF